VQRRGLESIVHMLEFFIEAITVVEKVLLEGLQQVSGKIDGELVAIRVCFDLVEAEKDQFSIAWRGYG